MPTDAWFRWLLVPAIAFSALASSTTWLADFWHHLARGRVIVEQGRLLDHDIFTFTVYGQTFQDVNWLSQVIYYGLHQASGLDGVRVVNAALVALTLVWLMVLCRRTSGSLTVALGLGILVFLGLWHILTIRPQTFSLLLFVALYDLIERSADRPAWLWGAPPILALWANLHGAFPAGLILIGAYWAEAAWRWQRERTDATRSRLMRLTLVGLASAFATLVNPYSWGIYAYVGATSQTAAARRIDEWLPPGLDTLIGIGFYASLPLLAGLVVAAWKLRGQRPSVRELCLVVAFLVLALGSVRMVAWWLIVIAPMAARRLTALWPNMRDGDAPRANVGAALSCLALLALMALSLPGWQRFNPLKAVRPADPTLAQLDSALEEMKRELGQGRVFTRFEWGEYLTWAVHPEFPVFMDGRIEIYPDEVWDAYAGITQGHEGWQRLLDHYGVAVLLLDVDYHRRTGLLEAVERSAAWQQRGRHGEVAWFTRAGLK